MTHSAAGRSDEGGRLFVKPIHRAGQSGDNRQAPLVPRVAGRTAIKNFKACPGETASVDESPGDMRLHHLEDEEIVLVDQRIVVEAAFEMGVALADQGGVHLLG